MIAAYEIGPAIAKPRDEDLAIAMQGADGRSAHAPAFRLSSPGFNDRAVGARERVRDGFAGRFVGIQAVIEDFRIDNMPARIAKVGDLWKGLLAARGRFRLEKVFHGAEH